MNNKKPKIAIIGAGVGGVLTVQNLRKKLPDAEFYLIDKNEHFVFTPRLTELFSESIPKEYIIAPMKVFKEKNIEVIRSNAKSVNLKKKRISLENNKTLDYDYVVFSQGARTNFFGNDKLREVTCPFKTEEDVEDLKKRVREAYSKIDKGKIKRFEIAIVGGGPTGTELAFAFRDFSKHHSRKGYGHNHRDIKISIIQGGKNLVPYFDERIIDFTHNEAEKEHIEVLTDKHVIDIKKGVMKFEEGGTKKADLIIWVAGVTPNIIKTNPKLELERNSMPVKRSLELKGFKDAFSIGDCSHALDPSNKPYAPTAQNARQEAMHVADNIYRKVKGKKLKDFKYKTRGVFLALGHHRTIAQAFSLVFDGFLGWFLRDQYYKKIFRELTR